MAREMLPATFATEARAIEWGQRVRGFAEVVPSRSKPGRFQVVINRPRREQPSAE